MSYDLVLGGAGFLGSHLADVLERHGRRVVIVDDMSLGENYNVERCVTGYSYDNGLVWQKLSRGGQSRQLIITDASEVIMHRLSDIGTIYNCAVRPLPESLVSPMSMRVNELITYRACEMVRMKYAKRLVHISSSEVYGTALYTPMDEQHALHPLTVYAASKAASDFIVSGYVHAHGISATIVRPFNMFGPRQNCGRYPAIIPKMCIAAMCGEDLVIHGDGSQSRDFVYVGDVAEATVDLAEHGVDGEIYNIGTGRATTINTLANTLMSILSEEGCTPYIVHGERRKADVHLHCGTHAKYSDCCNKDIPSAQRDVWLQRLEETVKWYVSSGPIN